MSALTFRNRLGELVDIQSVPATMMKNQFASVLDQALRGNPVAITRHDTTKAILISIEEFEALTGERTRSLDALGAQFDGLLARMQTPIAKKGMSDAFNASPQALGRAAVKAARK
ncbi:MAG: type II toxin-antitoxin system prevent-host-death family antitoxin [Betaproteobacteria bacterium]